MEQRELRFNLDFKKVYLQHVHELFFVCSSFHRTQLAYTYQLQGKNDDAQKLYNQVLKSKYALSLSM